EIRSAAVTSPDNTKTFLLVSGVVLGTVLAGLGVIYLSIQAGTAEGRALRIRREVVFAPLADDDGDDDAWSSDGPSPALSELSSATRAALADAWRTAAR